MNLDYNTIYSIYANPSDFGSWSGSAANTFVFPHSDGTNVSFADGHVKWVKRQSAISLDIRSWDATLP